MSNTTLPKFSPVAETVRIDAIDAVRGFALLGIFLVNIQFFGEAIGAATDPNPTANMSVGEAISTYSVKALCEGKFYPLFSMLFGMGLMLQFQRFEQRGGGFVGFGLRRLGVLLVFGLCHALLLWYGDILALYSFVGILLLFLARTRVRTLVWTGVGFLILAAALSGGLMAVMMSLSPSNPTPPPIPSIHDAPHYEDPFGQFWDGLSKGEAKEGPASPIWIQTERQAYREGPYDQLFKFRAFTWLMLLIMYVFGMGAHVAAMFLFGAALLKAGLFEPDRIVWHKRLLLVGVFVGLPLCVAAAFLPRLIPGPLGLILSGVVNFFGGPCLSLGYLGGISLLIDYGRIRSVTHALAMTGRMALTNYLMQTAVATTIFYYYGFGLFAQTTRVERVGIVLGVYFVQILLSVCWMRFFRFGPMEWLWRSLTYMRPQRIVRASPSASAQPAVEL